MSIAIGIIGYAGRMGQAITRVVPEFPDAVLKGGLVREAHSNQNERTLRLINPDKPEPLITNQPDKLFPLCDVLIDFSAAAAVTATLERAIWHQKPLVMGVTGLPEDLKAKLQDAAKQIPVLYASNTSLSLAVMKRIVKLAAQWLAPHDYDITILDRHHRFKKDAPSGTAKTLGEAVMAGNTGAHEPAYAAIRAGHIVGDHEVLFAGNGETISLHHSVTDRDIFARGAVQAALWLANKPAGFYTMDDVLEF